MDELKSGATDKRMADPVVGNAIRDLVSRELARIGADGLCNGECGCRIDDLMPCGCPDHLGCVAGRLLPATDEHIENTSEAWMIVPIANTRPGERQGGG